MKKFLILALLATTQAITKKDDGQSPPVEGKEQTCEQSKDGISVCAAPGDPNWTVEMNHKEQSQVKNYRTVPIQGDLKRGDKDAKGPLLKDPSTHMANQPLEMEAAKKKKKEALLQAAARSQKTHQQEIDMMSKKNVTLKANASKNVTANATKNVTANASQNATMNATAAKK